QCRMDRRYRHLLFDEFQDTSSLQWRVIADWLQSYAGAGSRPSVFVVGDPKQSIYRFRRAEARVFDAAKTLLREAFGAREASTDTTRRNAPAIVAALNRCLPAWMPHYREQATAAEGPEGFVWRLPLVSAPSDGATETEPPPAFDWLRSEREDDEPLRHHEGLAIADAVLRARAAFAAEGRVLRWSEVMVLARSRTGFEAYERALRERGLPVRSDRLGGLLRTLEGDDLRALLAFVRRPVDDLALAQVLASPLVGLPPAALAWIAARGPAAGPGNAAPSADDAETGRDAGMPEAFTSEAFTSEAFISEAFTSDDIPAPTTSPRRWWPRLRALAVDPDPADPPPFDAAALVARLSGWIDLASRVPVHDFLDATLSSADAFAAYPAAVDPAQREVAHANLCAMLGLALDVDAGRFPSLARFLRRLRGFDTLDEREGPDEGPAGAADAIRLMTIHGSKGLEADVVVLADAHGRAQPDGQRLHVDWSPEQARPSMVSFHLGSALVGRARDESFAREAMLREREDRNLLYVALTRAKVGLVVTGTRNRQSPKSSWYTVLDGIEPPPGAAIPPDAAASADGAAAAAASPGRFELPLLDLPPLAIGTRRDPGEGADERDEDGRPAGLLATELGHALHRALELLPVGADDATVLAAMHGFALDAAQRRAALARARAVTALASLRPAFDPAAPSACEFEIVGTDGEIRRIDRIARVGDEVWIVDYKWSVDARRRPDYVEQLAGYRALVAALEPPPFGAVVRLRTLLVDAGSGRVEFDVDLRPSTDGASPGPATAG
ncbi:MAG: 3'-5' exonuclease, partial [Burkholderiales bacterium]